MFHPETEYRGGIVIAYFLLLGIEAHALPNYSFVGGAGCAPDCEGHFEADGWGSFGAHVFVEIRRGAGVIGGMVPGIVKGMYNSEGSLNGTNLPISGLFSYICSMVLVVSGNLLKPCIFVD